MRINREKASFIGIGAVACVACCTAPIVGFLSAIGIGTAAGFAVFGTVALLAGAIAVLVVLRGRRARTGGCDVATSAVAVELPTVRARG